MLKFAVYSLLELIIFFLSIGFFWSISFKKKKAGGIIWKPYTDSNLYYQGQDIYLKKKPIIERRIFLRGGGKNIWVLTPHLVIILYRPTNQAGM